MTPGEARRNGLQGPGRPWLWRGEGRGLLRDRRRRRGAHRAARCLWPRGWLSAGPWPEPRRTLGQVALRPPLPSRQSVCDGNARPSPSRPSSVSHMLVAQGTSPGLPGRRGKRRRHRKGHPSPALMRLTGGTHTQDDGDAGRWQRRGGHSLQPPDRKRQEEQGAVISVKRGGAGSH